MKQALTLGRSAYAALMGLLLGVLLPASAAGVSAVDDHGVRIQLALPARRIVSLAPHITELLFAAGAGSRLVATVRHADYPEQAKSLPQVGDGALLDLERIAAMKPDLLVVWMHGNAVQQIERLEALNIPVYHSEPRDIASVADSLRRLGHLAGTDGSAEAAAQAFEAEHLRLRETYAARAPVRVFYQVWHSPLMTVNNAHLISDVLRLCGGVNVFADLPALVPTLDAEAVIKARPQVVLAGALPGREAESLIRWRGLAHFEPTRRNLLFVLPSDIVSRHGPRILDGTAEVCRMLDDARRVLDPSP